MGKNLPAMQEMWILPTLDQEDPLEEEMATHSIILAWEIPWTEEPGRLQSLEAQRVKLQLSMHTPHFKSQLDQKCGEAWVPGLMVLRLAQ